MIGRARNKKNWLKLNVALGSEMRVCERVFIVFGNLLVEFWVFLVFYFSLGSKPDGLGVINKFPSPYGLSDSFLLVFFGSFVWRVFLVIRFLGDFDVFVFILFFLLILLIKFLLSGVFISVNVIIIVSIINLLCDVFCDPQINRVIDKLRVSSNKFFDSILLNKLNSIFL